jgi:Zn-dependent protease with chaperone function
MSESVSVSPPDAFQGRIEPTRVSPLYQAGLGVVALAMVLLPLLYLALIAAMGWLVWWHLKHDGEVFEHVRGRGYLLAALLYFGPAVAGGIFVLFLIKPLFSRKTKEPKPFVLKPEDQPVLFAFVRKICEQVGAPVPREIRMDSQVNASAGFRRGWLSFFGRDLVLVIGTPLVAGMTMRQLAGVLAHEFGHFAQGAGMRFSYVIRSVNGWFARVVFERDSWDDRLDAWAQSEDWWLKVVFMLAKGGVWLGRRVLWCLMHAGHAISCFMSRQMEFDADSYEAKVAGSAEFGATSRRLRELGVAHAMAMNDAHQTFQTRELPDDLNALVLWRERSMPADLRQNLEKTAQESKTAWNDTHPADVDRVKAAEALAAPGVFHLEEPAAGLFRDFDALSRAVTRHMYEHEMELPMNKLSLRDSARMMQDRAASDDSGKALERFFGENFHFLRVSPIEWPLPSPVSLPTPAMPTPAAAIMPGIDTAEYQRLLAKYAQTDESLLKQTVGKDLLDAEFSLTEPQAFQLSSSNKSAAEASLTATRQRLRDLAGSMEAYEATVNERMRAGLDRWRADHPQPEDQERLDRLLNAQRSLARLVPDLLQTIRSRQSLELLFANINNHRDGTIFDRQARSISKRIELAANHCVTALSAVPHPYLDGHPPVSGVLHLPDAEAHPFAKAIQLATVCTDALIPLLVRVMGDLAALALDEKESAVAAPAV